MRFLAHIGRLSVLTTALLLVTAGPAAATTMLTPAGAAASRYQRWVDTSKVPTPAGALTVHVRLCPDEPRAEAWACVNRARTDVYLPRAAGRGTLLHEVGHVFSTRVLTLGDMDRFIRAMAWGRWHEEWFADAYSLCARGVTLREADAHELDGVGYLKHLSAASQRRACAVIRTAGD